MRFATAARHDVAHWIAASRSLAARLALLASRISFASSSSSSIAGAKKKKRPRTRRYASATVSYMQFIPVARAPRWAG